LIGLAEETAACLANPICRSILIDIASVATSPQPRPDDKGMCAGDYIPSTNANTQDDAKGGNANGAKDAPPNIQDLDKPVKGKEADKIAQEKGYENAHDAKKGRRNKNGDLYKDKKTGKVYVWDEKKTSEPELID